MTCACSSVAAGRLWATRGRAGSGACARAAGGTIDCAEVAAASHAPTVTAGSADTATRRRREWQAGDAARPNVLFILSDDQGAWALGCAGNPEIRTPELDRLAQRGVRFDNFFCTSPVCSPARASLLTGDIPSRHGVHDWIRVGSVGEHAHRLPGGPDADHRCRSPDAGYRCGLVGKWHLGASDVPRAELREVVRASVGHGPVLRRADGRRARAVHRATATCPTSSPTARSTFVRDEAQRAEPFWLSLNFTAPHYPWIDCHPKAYTDLYADCAFASCPDEAPHPWFAGGKPATDEGAPSAAREPDRLLRRGDARWTPAIGRVLDALDAQGSRESTLVDLHERQRHELRPPRHLGQGQRHAAAEHVRHVGQGAVHRVAAGPHRAGARQRRAAVSGYDVFPTLARLSRRPSTPLARKPGRSFRAAARRHALAEQRSRSSCLRRVRSGAHGPHVATGSTCTAIPDGPHELFDLVHDPGERTNLFDDSAPRNSVTALRARLDDWFAHLRRAAARRRDKGVTGCGQLGLVEDADAGPPDVCRPAPRRRRLGSVGRAR